VVNVKKEQKQDLIKKGNILDVLLNCLQCHSLTHACYREY